MTANLDRSDDEDASPSTNDIEPWWRDEGHCRELLPWLNDARTTSLNAARIAMHNSVSTPLTGHLEQKVAIHLAIGLPRAAWANADQYIGGAEIVDPLHPSTIRVRLIRLIAMSCAGYSCCGVREARFWGLAAARLCPNDSGMQLDYALIRFLAGVQVSGGTQPTEITTLGERLATTEGAESLKDVWIHPHGVLDQIRAAQTAHGSGLARAWSTVTHPRIGRRRSISDLLDLLRVAEFRRHQRREVAAICSTLEVNPNHVAGHWSVGAVAPLTYRPTPFWHPPRRSCIRCGRARRFALVPEPSWFVSGRQLPAQPFGQRTVDVDVGPLP